MLYCLVRGLLKILLLILGLKREGVHNLPNQGPIIVASNHVSNWDPIIVAISIHRPVYFMAKSELFKNVILGKLILNLNAFPVKRGGADKNAIKTALMLLEEGKILGIFPEGSRNRLTGESKVQQGVAMLSIRSNAPVIPIACIGTRRFLPIGWLSPVKIVFGRPIYPRDPNGERIYSNTEELSKKVMDEIRNLMII